MLLTTVAEARFAAIKSVPVERLIANLGRRVETSPTHQNHARLARMYSLAYAQNATDLRFPPRGSSDGTPRATPRGPAGYLALAVEHYRRAIELAPTVAHYHLGLAFAHEAGGDREEAAHRYLHAFDLAFPRDEKRERRPLLGFAGMVSHEAAVGYIRMAPTSADAARVKVGLAKLKDIPRGMITPIIFSLAKDQRLQARLTSKIVCFDLDGDLEAEPHRWISADTYLLTWDPTGEGRVQSGRDLFGNVTWWLFWDDGYQPLAALDDDADGTLRGDELDGLAGWRDTDGDGVSDPGEVEPLSVLGITALATTAEQTVDGTPQHRRGATTNTGRRIATYDWMATPLPPRLGLGQLENLVSLK